MRFCGVQRTTSEGGKVLYTQRFRSALEWMMVVQNAQTLMDEDGKTMESRPT